MKISLDRAVISDPERGGKVRLGDILENALFKSSGQTGISNARGLYDKIKGQTEVDLTVGERAEIQKAVNVMYIHGVQWQIEDIFEGEETNKTKK